MKMALSDYDMLAFNHKGEPCNGVVKNEKGNSLEIYKTWLYVRAPKMWQPGSDFCDNIIASIAEGQMHIGGFKVQAKRFSRQNTIFVLATYSKGPKYTTQYFGGIGCRGYGSKIEQILKENGMLKQAKANNEHWHDCASNELNGKWSHYIENMEARTKIVYWQAKHKDDQYPYEADWVGVDKEMLRRYWQWVEKGLEDDYDHSLKRWIKRCKKGAALRVNQGDLFFSKYLGVDPQATEPGQAEKPLILDMLKN
jgi:hypothetical protein